MDGFHVDEKNKIFYKIVGGLKFCVKIDPFDILDINILLRRMGVFDFGLMFYIEDLENGEIKKYPTEISGVAYQTLHKNYKMPYKNARHEESKVRVYANIVAFCQLTNILLKSLTDLIESN